MFILFSISNHASLHIFHIDTRKQFTEQNKSCLYEKEADVELLQNSKLNLEHVLVLIMTSLTYLHT